MSFSIEQLSFAYARQPVLNGVSSGSLLKGRLTALLGPNAAGKSTLFRCIAGLLQPESGRLLLGDNRLHEMDRAERIHQVCYMPQSYNSTVALTVFEVVLLARKQLRDWRVTDDDIEAVSKLLRRFAIEHLAEQYIGELSGGQQQMVALCQSMVRTADLYLLDEPTSALDLRRQLEVMQTLCEITRERGVVCIAAMHDLNLAARFAEHIVLMKDGEIRASGATEQVLESPQLAETYEVDIELKRSKDRIYMVGASLLPEEGQN
ncbi:MAG: ABC transporter ATP-binding protein [Candidatus Thiodiazotropha sp. (ex Ctena orbiculata)]|nr:ABC transporter ATP-binding protein [Candidatus Thiodiazotropha taylori]